MARYKISPPTKDCIEMGVDVGGGVVKNYPVQKDGYVHVDNERHARALTREVGEMAVFGGKRYDPRGDTTKAVGTKTCAHCGFEAWAFSTHCPRCGKELKEIA